MEVGGPGVPRSRGASFMGGSKGQPHPVVQSPCAPGVRARDVALVEDQIRLARPRASEVLGEGHAHVLRGLG